jgi:predicted nucleic-acid-binding protein
MTSSILIDTNILVRHFVRDVMPQAEHCTQFLEEMGSSTRRGYVPNTVVLELVFTLERQYQIDRDGIADALMELVEFSGVEVQNREALIRSLDTYRERRSVSFADSFHCAIATANHNAQIASYDQALSRVPGITRIEPGDALA